mmetsp:Transcript_18155/g.28067  ORF Transcript_18155/g.28067 Transcript_18155/m.28067 type:complete len:274 (-) Transcript_18155:37-858(-)
MVKCNDLIKDTAWVLDEVLTKEECRYFIKKAEDDGIHKKQSAGDTRHRDSTTIAIDEPDMAKRVYERIERFLPQEVVIDENTNNIGLSQHKEDSYGRWKPYKLNARWRIVCYPGRGHFGPHRDGCHIEDENHRSLITLNGYLTDRPLGYGGSTRFLVDDVNVFKNEDGIFTIPDDNAILHKVEADSAGKAVLFFHDLMHDGEPLKEGSSPKWLFRTEVMFERDLATAPFLTWEQREARQLLQEAEKAEVAGDVPKAIHLYNKAYRLDPTLENT